MRPRKKVSRSPDAPKPGFGRFAPLGLTLLGALLLWASYPPVGLPWLAWLAPLPWLLLVRSNQFTGRGAYLQAWLGGTLFWIALLEGIRRAHPLNNLGLLALSMYLGAYMPVFVGVTRAAVNTCRVPLAIAAPVVWTALEFARGYLLTGFSMGLLGHTQVESTTLIQIADLFGAYGVSFLIMFVAACGVNMLPREGQPARVWPAVAACVAMLMTGAYGSYRLGTFSADDTQPNEQAPALKVALLQGTRDKIFEYNRERDEKTFEQYWELMRRAREEHPDLDVIVWPEATFSVLVPEVIREGNVTAPKGLPMSDEEFNRRLADNEQAFKQLVENATKSVNRVWRNGAFEDDDVFLLVGAETRVLKNDSISPYNSVLLINPQGEIIERYYKTHPVMFGEYIPFGDVIPLLYRLTPMQQGLSRGDRPESFEVKGFRFSPSVCFESTVPHLIRRHARQFEQEHGSLPDVLVNVTDDGWFWGSTMLDLQLACGVFRAVELRRPTLVAANTGISAWVDGNGRVVERGPKREEKIIVAKVARDGRRSLYYLWGDTPAIICLLATLFFAGRGYMARRRSNAGRDVSVPELSRRSVSSPSEPTVASGSAVA